MNLTLSDVALLFGVLAAAMYAWHAIGLKQKALQAVSTHCEELNLQLLDHSLVLCRLRLAWGSTGIYLIRHYRFEFSSTGDRRHQGTIALFGSRIEHIHLEPYVVVH